MEQQVTSLLYQLKAEGAWDERKHDIHALRRFLKARSCDVNEAKRMWLCMLQWRQQWQADTILEQQLMSRDQQRRLVEVYPHGLHGVDHVGRPILIYRLGSTNVSTLKKEFPDFLMRQFHIQTYEFIMRVALPACSLAAGKHLDQVTTIVDLEGMGLWDMPKIKDLLLPTMSMNGDNYPETLAQMVVINAPAMFDSAFAVVKKMLSPDTQKKVQVLGKSYHAALGKLVSKSQLPKQLGGSSEASLADNYGPWQQLQHMLVQQQQAAGGKTHPSVALTASCQSLGPEAWHSCRSDYASWSTALRSSLHSLSELPQAVQCQHRPSEDRTPLSPSVCVPEPGVRLSSSEAVSTSSRVASLSVASYHSCLSAAESASLAGLLSSGAGDRPPRRSVDAGISTAAKDSAGGSHQRDTAPVKDVDGKGPYHPPAGLGCFGWLGSHHKRPVGGQEGSTQVGQQGARAAVVGKGSQPRDYEWDDDNVNSLHDQQARAGEVAGSCQAASRARQAPVPGHPHACTARTPQRRAAGGQQQQAPGQQSTPQRRRKQNKQQQLYSSAELDGDLAGVDELSELLSSPGTKVPSVRRLLGTPTSPSKLKVRYAESGCCVVM